jgi:hypothetical protein
MWDVEARAVAETARGRGDPITVLTADEVAPWRKATEPVIAAWYKQMKEKKLDGDKLLADVPALLAKYAEEPEPEQPQAPRPAEQPAEQQAVTEPPQMQAAEPRSHGFRRPRADAPAVEAAAPPTSTAQSSSMQPSAAPSSPAPAAAPAPAAKPAPAPVAAPKLKELDIPL